jgi:zinc protease
MNRTLPLTTPLTRLLAALTLSALLHQTAARAADEPARKLPPAKEIIAKYVKAIGGREAILKQTSTHATGKFEMPAQGLSGTLEVFAAQPNKLLVKIDIAGFGKVSQGFDGKVGWTMDPAQGPMVLKDKMLEQITAESDFYSPLHEEKNYTSMETLELTKFEGKDSYKLKLVRKNGRETSEFYDVKTGLLNGTLSTQDTALGALPVTSIVGEYREFGGVKMPAKVTQKIGPAVQVLTITASENNQVADAEFELPAPIKTLVNP